MKSRKKDGLSSAELSSFCGQVALILEAGIPLYDGMETLAGVGTNSDNADLYTAASRKVTATGSLYEALEADERWPRYLVEMVGIGEKSGQLDKVMRGLEGYYAREDRIRSSIVGAVTYPVVLGVMLIVIVLILLWRVLPVFNRVLNSMGITMNQSGNALLNVGTILGWVVMAVVAVLLIAVLVFVILMRTKHRAKVLNTLQHIVPSLHRLQKKLSASRVAGVLSMMLAGGFPTGEALTMTSAVLDDQDAAAQVDRIRRELENGQTFAEALTGTEIFDELQNRMITMGSATGREDQVLSKIASLNEEQAEEDISRLVSIIEPTLVALLAIIIGAVLLSVMMSMAGILTNL
ncbi:MAG: type II secretion system F family protein [Parasporobacterium sp.]|nr:type II secretion system F family protein [Parasporobacterium sp.]